MNRAIKLIVSIDTEEDNWVPASTGINTSNIRALPRLAAVFQELGVRPTYFTTYQVAADRGSAAVLREIGSGPAAEIGAHLHPWNTPPVTEGSLEQFGSMLFRYPERLQRAKLETLTDALIDAFGEVPRSFRAGRFGMAESVVPALAACGYTTDSSVTPFIDWSRVEDAPDFGDFDLKISDLSEQFPGVSPDVDMVEVPITVGYTRFPSRRWPLMGRVHRNRLISRLGIPALLARTGILARVILSPETTDTKAMLAVARHVIEGPVGHLHLFLHSSSLSPGLTPFARNQREVERLVRRIQDFIHDLSAMAEVSFATVGEAAREFRAHRNLDG